MTMPIWAQGTFQQRFDLFTPDVDPNTDGRGTPGNRGWSVVARGLPYFHLSTRNFSEPSVMGRALQPSSISVEFGYGPVDTPWSDQDCIRDVTPGGALNGSVYRVLGAPTLFDGIPVADAAYSSVELRELPHPPEDLPA